MSGLLGLLAMMMLNLGLDSLSSDDDEEDNSSDSIGNDSAGITDDSAAVGSLLDDLGEPRPEDPEPDTETDVSYDDFGNPLPPVVTPEPEIPVEYDDYGNVMDSPTSTHIAAVAKDPVTNIEGSQGQSVSGPTEGGVAIAETGADTITGTEGTGTAGDDTLDGTVGDDQSFADAGDDTLSGGEGDDTLIGGSVLDVLKGGDGMDMLLGVGEDPATVAQTLDDLSQSDTLDGGAGNDSLYMGAGDIATGGDGEDSFVTGEWVGDSEAPVITDFAVTQDQLVVMYDPSDATAPDLAITSTAEGDLLVSLSGQTIARLVGDTTGFSLDNISLVAM